MSRRSRRTSAAYSEADSEGKRTSRSKTCPAAQDDGTAWRPFSALRAAIEVREEPGATTASRAPAATPTRQASPRLDAIRQSESSSRSSRKPYRREDTKSDWTE